MKVVYRAAGTFRGVVDSRKQLWCSVLMQTINDASGEFGLCTYDETLEARRWLTEKINRWREWICDAADINEQALVDRARKRFA